MKYHVLFLSSQGDGLKERVSTCAELSCESTHTAQFDTALEHLAAQKFDAIVVLEGGNFPNAVGTCRALRTRTSVPVVLQCKHDSEERVVQAFQAGAQEFVTADVSQRIFAARLLNVLSCQRSDAAAGQHDGLLVSDNLVLDLESRSAWVEEVEIPLTRIEFDILSLLMAKPNRVFTRTEIIDNVWRDEWYGDDHVLETHVSRLRKKVLNHGGPKLLTSLRGVGYRLLSAVPPSLVDSDGSPTTTKG